MVIKVSSIAVIAAAISTAVVAAYYAKLCHSPDIECYLSDKTDVWGQFGDYVGGLLNPVLSFLSIILLLRSLTLQREANADLRKELLNNEKSEKLRAFDGLFFGMIDSQKKFLSELSLAIDIVNPTIYTGVPAIIRLEVELEKFGKDQKLISSYIDAIDSTDQIFGISRAFYITVRIITDKLNDTNGFNSADRKDRLLTLVNFTDLAHLRLIAVSMKYLDFYSSEYLNSHAEFNEVLKEVNLLMEEI